MIKRIKKDPALAKSILSDKENLNQHLTLADRAAEQTLENARKAQVAKKTDSAKKL